MPRCFNCDEFVGSEDVCGVCHTAVCSTCCVNYDAGSAHDADVHLIPMWDEPEAEPDFHAEGEECDCPNGGLL
jgi:hypothetical protein